MSNSFTSQNVEYFALLNVGLAAINIGIKGTQSEGAENRTLEHFQSTCHAETSRQNTMFLFLTENVDMRKNYNINCVRN